MSRIPIFRRFLTLSENLCTRRTVNCDLYCVNGRLYPNSFLSFSSMPTAANEKSSLNMITKTIVNEMIANVGREDMDEISESDDPLPHWVQTPIDFQLFKAKTLDDLLNLAEKYRFSGLQCVSFLARLCNFAPLNIEKLQKDIRFKTVCQTLNNEIQYLSTGSVILALRSLLFLNVDKSSGVVEQLRNAVMYMIRLDRMSPSILVPFACFHVDCVAKDCQSSIDLQEKMEENIILHLAEINDVKLILLLLNKIPNRDPKWVRPIELRAMDMIELMNVDDLIHLLNYVAAMRSRNVPLLKAACSKICAENNTLSIKSLINLLMAANRLNFHDTALLTRICDGLSGQIQSINNRTIYQQLCTQIGNCRLRNETVLTNLVDWTGKNYDLLKPVNLCWTFIMLARCNFVPPNSADNENVLIRLRDSITLESVHDPVVWLDYAWSLTILRLLNVDVARSVLKKEFYESLIQDDGDFRTIITKLKLLNINTAAKLELKGYSGPFLEQSIYETLPKQHSLTKHKLQAVSVFLDSLTRAPAKYRLCDRICPEGYVIDAEMRMDNYARPLPLEKWTGQEIKIAFMLWDYFDKTLVTTHLTGLNAMAVRHLELSGYTVIEVNANELFRQKESLKRTMFLNKLIEEKVQFVNKLNEEKMST